MIYDEIIWQLTAEVKKMNFGGFELFKLIQFFLGGTGKQNEQ